MSALDFVSGCFGGAAGVLVGHPLDTVKVRLQTQNGIYRGPIHCFTSIVKLEGVRGLYKGMTSPLASLTFMNAIIFGVHGHVMRMMGDTTSIWTHFVAGCAAGSAQGILASPTELFKLRVQIQTDDTHIKYKSPYHCFQTILKEEGVSKLGRGMIATQARDCPAFGIYFASYEYMGRMMSKDGTIDSLNNLQLLFAGGAAGMFSWVLNYPTDVVKTRFQACDNHTSYLRLIHQTYTENGIRAFFAGYGTTLVRAFPTNAATFFAVEWTKRIYFNMKTSQSSSNLDYTLSSKQQRYINTHDLWNKNFFFLPEAGSTYIDPMIHGSRFL
ncbi:hypothetical protein FO519_002874 [Halicephalobus sp. NKZ332]|nr:hypothetical protein FO519_002874 [Halicephalobus sp. NKZ332]